MSSPAPTSRSAATADDASSGGKTNFLAALFKGRSNEDDEEGAAPAVNEKPASASVVAAVTAKSAETKSAETVPMPRAKPQIAATLQLASADAQIVPAPKAKPAAPAADKAEREAADAGRYHQCPRLLGRRAGHAEAGDTCADRRAEGPRSGRAADPQPTASVSDKFNKALAYAPAASSPVDRSNIVAASAPIPRSVRPPAMPLPPPPRSTPSSPRARRAKAA